VSPLLALAAPQPLWFPELGVSGLSLLVVLLTSIALLVALSGLRGLIAILPIRKSRREQLRRARPVVETVVVVLYLAIAVPKLFGDDERLAPVVLAVLLLGLIAVSWSAIRDLINGIFIKAGALCQVGDRVEVEDTHGRVKRLGYRVLTLETDAGEEVFIPYGRLSRRSLVRTPRLEGVHRHSFELALPAERDPVRAIHEIKAEALGSHWACVVRSPEVEALEGGRLRVHVFALGREQGVAIEAAVRRSSGAATDQP